MSFLKLAQKRQSCRKYADIPVPTEALERCLEAARLSPSACNSQPWRFIVVSDLELKNKLAENAFSGMHAMNSFARKAPVLVVVVTERSKYAAQLAGSFKGIQYSLIDIGIAGEHFCLQATEEGLGTCWLGWFDQNKVRKVLGFSRKDKIDIIISVGYPESKELREKNRKNRYEIFRFR